ncbi:transporter substrate-binding domain-containing protein [Pseudomonas sp. NPDC007930]|uniref:transporter substrate-binding domain-containing protein n=1 Tax=Pseudomonas sp. NPDC007930 TaxID=3364417 RepID=UPI0036EA04E1
MKHSHTVCKPAGLLRTLALAACLLGVASTASADVADIKTRGYLSVATEDDYAPFNYIVDGKPEGFHKELLEDLKAYAKTQGFDVRQEILPWTGLLASVSSGKYDMAFTGALVTDERLRVFNFAPPFASAQHFYVKRAGDNRLSDIASLCGKTVGVQAGSALLARLPELKKMMAAKNCQMGDVVEYPSYPEAYADLANGRLDYVVNALISVNDLVKTRGDTFAKGIAVSGDGFAAWPVPKASPELLKFLTGFMDHIRDNGRLAALQTKWFGEAFPSMPKEPVTNVEQFHKLAGME